jgi:hypothetical protein
MLLIISLAASAQTVKRNFQSKKVNQEKVIQLQRPYYKNMPYIMSTQEIDVVWDKILGIANTLKKEKQVTKFLNDGKESKISSFRSNRNNLNILLDIVEWPGKLRFSEYDARFKVNNLRINLPQNQINLQNYSFPKMIDGRIVVRVFNFADDHFYIVVTPTGESYATDITIHSEIMQ